MIDLKQLKDIIHKEEDKEVWRRVELSNKDVEIKKLKEQIKWRDYYKDPHIPVTDLVNIHTAKGNEIRLDNLMQEVDNISAFAFGIVTTWLFVIVVLIVLLGISV